jgi:hypothetical protein
MRYECWPPPDWPEVVVTWTTMLNTSNYSPNNIIVWNEHNIKRRWHLHGYKGAEGFAFRFEDARDATAFGLRWL